MGFDFRAYQLYLATARGAAPADVRDGVMIALHPDPRTQRKLIVKGGLPSKEIHLTMAYMGKTADVDKDKLHNAVKAWADKTAPLRGQVTGHGLFTQSEDGPVTVHIPDVPGLSEARADLVSRLAKAGMPQKSEHGFTPHLTASYTDNLSQMHHGGTKLDFPHASLVYGAERTDYPFGGS